ncbi:hypothetical protein ACOME3_007285 [Neoechinorhynchus agilis]
MRNMKLPEGVKLRNDFKNNHHAIEVPSYFASLAQTRTTHVWRCNSFRSTFIRGIAGNIYTSIGQGTVFQWHQETLNVAAPHESFVDVSCCHQIDISHNCSYPDRCKRTLNPHQEFQGKLKGVTSSVTVVKTDTMEPSSTEDRYLLFVLAKCDEDRARSKSEVRYVARSDNRAL